MRTTKRIKYRCEHGLVKYNCRICKPKILCEHNIVKNGCRKCNSNLNCQHGRTKDIVVFVNLKFYVNIIFFRKVVKTAIKRLLVFITIEKVIVLIAILILFVLIN